MKENKVEFEKFRKSPQGKAILFFGFYLFFFVLIFIYAHTNRGTRSTAEYEKGNPYQFEIKSILNENYHYMYTIIVDGEKFFYEGDRTGKREFFTYQDHEYYREDETYYRKDEEWKEVENPYSYYSFLDPEVYFSLLDLATYDSKTVYENGKVNYNFLISTNTINQKIHEIDSDYLEEPNIVTLSANEEKEIDQITWNLDSYCLLNSFCEKSLKIKIQYNQFGEIVDIKSPME